MDWERREWDGSFWGGEQRELSLILPPNPTNLLGFVGNLGRILPGMEGEVQGIGMHKTEPDPFPKS